MSGRRGREPGGRRPSRPPERPPEPRVVSLLPEIPEELELHPFTAALLTVAAFLDLGEEDEVQPDAARRVLERVGLYVQRLSDDEIEELAADLERVSAHAKERGWPEEAREFVAEFLSYCGFELEGAGEEDAGEEDAGEDERDAGEDEEDAGEDEEDAGEDEEDAGEDER